MALLVALKFCNLGLNLGCNYKNLCILILNSLSYLLNKFVAVFCTVLIYVTNVHYRFVGKQVKLFGNFLVLSVVKSYNTCRFALLKNLFIFYKDIIQFLGILVSTCLSLFLNFADAVFYCLKVFKLKLCINDLLVPYRVYRTVYVNNVRIIKTS